MVITQKNINLFDLIDKQFLQELQDNFSKTTGLACVTIDKNGFATEPSGFCEFCLMMKDNEKSNDACSKCDLEKRKSGFNNQEPFIYECHAGLTNFVVPIVVEGKTLALMVGGQTLTKDLDEDFYKQLAQDFNINEKKYLEKIKKVKCSSSEKIEAAAKLLSQIANFISNTAHQNYELREKSRREEIIRDIIEKIRSTLDKDEIKKYFIETICDYFKADRCLFVDYDSKINKFYPFRLEKLRTPDLKSLANVDVEESFPEFSEKIKRGKNIIIRDVEKTLQKNQCIGHKSLESLKISDAKSDYGLLISYREEIMGCIILHFLAERRNLTHDEFEFLKILRDHAGTALYQAELYLRVKDQAKRETISRQIIETVRSSLDIDEVQKKVTAAIGKAFNADRCYFRRQDKKLKNVLASEIEYRASEDVESILNIEPSKDLFKFFLEKVEKEKKGFYPIGIDREFTKGTPLEKYMIKYNITEDYAIPMIDRHDEIFWLVMHYSKPAPNLSEEDKKLLETIAYQLDIAFEQINLYNITLNTAKKEKLLRDIISDIRNTLDVKETKTKIVNTICPLFKADRCYIAEYDSANDKILTVEDEYLSSDKVKSYKNLDLNTSIPVFVESIKQKKQILINDSEIMLETDKDLSLEKQNIQKHNIKSGLGFPIVYKDELLGIFSLNFVKEHHISKDELDFLSLITDQIAIAIHQSKLHTKTIEQADRENFLKTIIESVITTLNIDDAESKIIELIGQRFRADRCFIMEYNKTDNKFLTITNEYRSSEDIASYKGVNLNENIPVLVANFKEGKSLVFDKQEFKINETENISIHNSNFIAEKKTITNLEVNSALVLPLKYSEELLGDLVLHYVSEELPINSQEVDFIRIIANQVSIAIHQAKLYNKIQLQSERERISRNIIEIMRSSLDKNIIKKLFIKNLGKYFKADRVFICEFDTKKNTFLSVDENSEFLSDNELKSFVGIDWSQNLYSYFVNTLIERREIRIPFVAEYIKNNQLPEEQIEFFRSGEVKSTYSFPITYQDNLMASFTIEFTSKAVELLEEDIARIRSICTQAGIALYHADLYLTAQEALQSKNQIINKVKNYIEKPIYSIIQYSKELSEQTLEEKQREYLNHIVESCNQLLELTKDISMNF